MVKTNGSSNMKGKNERDRERIGEYNKDIEELHKLAPLLELMRHCRFSH